MPAKRIRRAQSERGYIYSTDYPAEGGHSYNLVNVPQKIWDAAAERAQVRDKKSMRVVLIRLLAHYGKGDVKL
jgi:hypothetical protein